MSSLADFFGSAERLHHGYLVIGERGEVLPAVAEVSETFLHSPSIGNPDYVLLATDVFTVEESRALTESVARRAFSGGRRVFVVAANFFTAEAENALLKTLEEPAEGTHLFLVVPEESRLSPTVRSRLFAIRHDGSSRMSGGAALSERFLSASAPERLRIAKEIAEAVGEGTESRQSIFEFLNGIERSLENMLRGRARRPAAASLREVLRVRRYLSDRGASPKLILEYLALTVSRIS